MKDQTGCKSIPPKLQFPGHKLD